MSKNIKLVTLLGDEEVVVGHCHPGQARILRKAGMAEWVKGKLILGAGSVVDAKPVLETSKGEEVLGIGFSSVVFTNNGPAQPGHYWNDRGEHRPLAEWTPAGIAQKPFIWRDSWKEEMEEIDPEGLLGPEQEPPTEIKCQNFLEWAKDILRRRGEGHTLYIADDPRRMMYGFVDDDTNEHVVLRLSAIKMATDVHFREAGVDREAFGTKVGRAALIEGRERSTFGYASQEEVDALKDCGLESIWAYEIEETLGEAARAAGSIRLADDWSRTLNVEEIREKVGLLPREQYLKELEEAKKERPEAWEGISEERRTGRTTEILLEAAFALLQGMVVYVQSYDHDQSLQMQERVQGFLKHLYRTSEYPEAASRVRAFRGRRGEKRDEGSVLFKDHSNTEGGHTRHQGHVIHWYPRKGKWVAWVSLDMTHQSNCKDLTKALANIRKKIDQYMEVES